MNVNCWPFNVYTWQFKIALVIDYFENVATGVKQF